MTEFKVSPSWPRYRAGEDGSIIGARGRLLKPFIGNKGYRCINVWHEGGWKQLRVHFLVCEAFHGPRPDGAIVAHRDGDKLNNAAANLRWTTAWQNEADKREHGTAGLGERNPGAKLTESDVRAIRAARVSGVGPFTLGRQYGIAPATVWRICTRRTWAHIA